MTRKASRASPAQLNRIHKLVGKAIERELKEAMKNGGRVPAAILGKAVDYLKMTGVTAPERGRAEKKRLNDELMRILPVSYDDDDDPIYSDRHQKPQAPREIL